MEDLLDLNVDLTQTDNSFPVLADNQCQVMVQSAEVIDNKDKTGKNLLVIVKTTQEYPSSEGVSINPGYQLRSYFPLQNTDNEAFDFKKNLAGLVDALFKPASDADRPIFNNELIGMMAGREALATVKVGEYQGSPSNELKRLTAIG